MKCFKREKLIERTEQHIGTAKHIMSMIERDILSYTAVVASCDDCKAKEHVEALELRWEEWSARLGRLYRLLNRIAKEKVK